MIFWTHDDILVYLKGKGKHKRVFTTGEGHGRPKNPGNVMICRKCSSGEHFEARCPQGGKGSGKGTSGSFFSGLAVDTSQRDPYTASGSQPAEASSTEVPWSHNDIVFEPPRSIFFQSTGEDTIGSSGKGQQAETGTTPVMQDEVNSDASSQASSFISSSSASTPERFQHRTRPNGVRVASHRSIPREERRRRRKAPPTPPEGYETYRTYTCNFEDIDQQALRDTSRYLRSLEDQSRLFGDAQLTRTHVMTFSDGDPS
jgi:hypothetical protein